MGFRRQAAALLQHRWSIGGGDGLCADVDEGKVPICDVVRV